jgi:hypothetical protein
MKPRGLLFKLSAAIAAITIVTGFVQMLRPDLVLGIIGADTNPAPRHFFGIVGMFMVLFGGMLLHALFDAGHHRIVVLWSGLQKVAASGAVALGVWNGIFSTLALGVAGFDLFSGAVIFLYMFGLPRGARTDAATRAPATAQGAA